MRRSPQAAGVRRGGLPGRLKRAALAAGAALLLSTSPAAPQPPDTLAAGSVRVVYAPRQRVLARQTLAAAVDPFHLPGLGRLAAPDSTTILLAPTPAAFRAATGGRAPEWAGGVAIPAARTLVLPAYPAAGVRPVQAAVTLRHEIAHLVLHERLPPGIPRWFDEGYAEVAAGGWDVESAWQLRVAFVVGGVPPLDSLALGWPRGAERARLAYLLSATAVDYLHRRGGERGLTLLFASWRERGSLEAALRSTYGITLDQFEAEWRRDVRRRHGWLLGLANAAVIWSLAAVLAMVAWIPRRRRNRARMEAMRAEERMLPPPREDGVDLEYPLPEAEEEEEPEGR
ncbi:MAG TPA: hypothetical protein VEW03_10195 [Longimicrobiaceae bacterium]|nr:hypothetical protein [Longimicrobiaceae bacterium]